MDIVNICVSAQEIAEEYGYEAQSRQLIEEMAELTQAINKDWRIHQKFEKTKDQSLMPDIDTARRNLIEELADVYIVWHQIAYLTGAFEVTNTELEDTICNKIDRQMEKIEKSRAEEKPPISAEMKGIKTAEELLEANYDELTPEEKERLCRVKRIPPAVRENFQNVEEWKRNMIIKLEKERDAILDYLNGFTDGISEGGDLK